MPGIEPKSKVIGEHEYTIEPHGAIKGRSLLLRLAKLAGSALNGVTAGNIESKLGDLLAGLDDETVALFCDEFAKKTLVSTDAGGQLLLSKVFDTHFQGSYVEMCKWLAFAVEVNFGGFFRELKAKEAAPKAPEKA